jgi:hypothetical protein
VSPRSEDGEQEPRGCLPGSADSREIAELISASVSRVALEFVSRVALESVVALTLCHLERSWSECDNAVERSRG